MPPGVATFQGRAKGVVGKPPVVETVLLNHGASPKLMGYQFSSIANPDGTFKTERTLILSADTLIKLGIKYQRSPNDHSIARSWLIAHLRDHMDLPVDAMLPLNANSLYLRPEPTAPK